MSSDCGQQLNLDGRTKVEESIKRLRDYEPPEGYFLATSCGKDSNLCEALCIAAGVRYEPHYSQTGIDPPEHVEYIRQYHANVIWDRPRKRMWALILSNGLPTRQHRFCCRALKEYAGKGRIIITGIRRAENPGRRNRTVFEVNHRDHTTHYLNPIVDWSDEQVWDYLIVQGLPQSPLYAQGYTRIGCILCPMGNAAQAKRQAERWPKIADAYYRAGERFWHRSKGAKKKWPNGPQQMFDWWMSRKPLPKKTTQLKMDE